MKPKPKKMKPRDLAPITVDEATWLYAERKALCVVHQGKIFNIPWRAVRQALQEKEARKS